MSYDPIEQIFRREHGRVLAAVVATVGDLNDAQDLVADAFRKALVLWPERGTPDKPGAWLLTVARNAYRERLRHHAVVQKKQQQVLEAEQDRSISSAPQPGEYPDKRLELIFTCCHPALEASARVALTLHTLGGLTTDEVARAFLVALPTMSQRLVRAKRKIKAAGIPYRVPDAEDLPERISSVLRVLYLIFTEGYRASRGDAVVRTDLCEEALYLATGLNELLPQTESDSPAAQAARAEALGLEALMRFHHARRDARQDAEGIVLLEDQDRSLWRKDETQVAHLRLERALLMRALGPYQLQAAIAAHHSMADRFEDTNWEVIVDLYERLYTLEPTPVVALNHAAAVGTLHGPRRGLEQMRAASLARPLAQYAPYHAARGELLRRLGDKHQARAALARACELATHALQRQLFERQLTLCDE